MLDCMSSLKAFLCAYTAGAEDHEHCWVSNGDSQPPRLSMNAYIYAEHRYATTRFAGFDMLYLHQTQSAGACLKNKILNGKDAGHFA